MKSISPKLSVSLTRLRAVHHSFTSPPTRHSIAPRRPLPSTITAASKAQSDLTTVLALALPALGIVLSDPLQTLIDSACVGRQSTLQLAALGPNTAIFNSVFQIFSFIGIATANFVATNSINASQIGKGMNAEEVQLRRLAASSSLSNSILLGLLLGCVATVTINVCGRGWLMSMGTDAAVLPLAAEYMGIRALATPAVLITNACQGACLGQQDTLTPMWIAAAATLLNIIGDIYLVWVLGMGVAGAAIATVSAQYCAMVLILWRVWVVGKSRSTSVPLRWMGLPKMASLRPFLDVGATLISRTAAGMIAYFAMAVAATRLGTSLVAAHQIAMQIFWFLSFFPEPLSMAAQSLIAKERGSSAAAKTWAWLLLRCSFLSGVLLTGAVAAALYFGAGLFTTDLVVQEAVRSLVPHGAAAMAICTVMMAFDGISIGAGSFSHLPVAVGLGMAAVLCVLWGGDGGLSRVWVALVAFYGTRLVGHLLYYIAFWEDSVFGGGGGGGDSEKQRSLKKGSGPARAA